MYEDTRRTQQTDVHESTAHPDVVATLEELHTLGNMFKPVSARIPGMAKPGEESTASCSSVFDFVCSRSAPGFDLF